MALNSIDFVLADAMNWSLAANTAGVAPKSVPRATAAILVTADAQMWFDPFALNASGTLKPNMISIPAGGSVLIGLELQDDITPVAFNPGAGAQRISVAMLRRRRALEKFGGEV